jgi:hypothetical protein
MKRLLSIAAGLLLAAFGGQRAAAGLLPINVTVTPEVGNFRWTYAIVLPTDMKLQSGNFFTVYDFNEYVPGSADAPAGWALSVSKNGPTPDRLNPQDDPLLDNLTWKYSGPTIESGQIGLGNFWALSKFSQQGDSFLTASTLRTSDGKSDNNITSTIVPIGAIVAPPPPGVPEPTTLVLAGLGLPLVGLARRLRRRA